MLYLHGAPLAAEHVDELEPEASAGQLVGLGKEPDDLLRALVGPGDGAAAGQFPDGVPGEAVAFGDELDRGQRVLVCPMEILDHRDPRTGGEGNEAEHAVADGRRMGAEQPGRARLDRLRADERGEGRRKRAIEG